MSASTSLLGGPADTARATLRYMAVNQIAPTPENYAAAWEAVGGSNGPRTLPMTLPMKRDSRGPRRPRLPGTLDGAGSSAQAAQAAESGRTADRNSRLIASMTGLIETMCEVVPTLVEDEQWVSNQFAAVRKAVRPPQGVPDRGELEQARQLLLAMATEHRKLLALRRESVLGVKGVLAQWLVSLGNLSDRGRDYTSVLNGFAERVETAGTLEELASVLAATTEETGTLCAHLESARDDLEKSCNRAQELEQQVSALSEQLSNTSAQLVTDHLTDVLNRRGLEQSFHQMWQACQAQEKPLALVLLDLDDFKKVNDSLGHQAGDEALRQFAATIKSRLRPEDKCSRFGGEEFVLLLSGATVAVAVDMVWRLQRAVAVQALEGGAKGVKLTFSGGVAQVEAGGLAKALELADEALYEAKRSGKNRVCSRQ